MPGRFSNSATVGVDFALPSITIIEFAPYQRVQTVEIDITSENPADYEGEEDFTLMLEPTSSLLLDQIGYPHKATIVITDQCKSQN